MANTRLWLNQPYGCNEDVAGVCAMSSGLLKQCSPACRITEGQRVPISGGFSLYSG
jgi:hypothetical protein